MFEFLRGLHFFSSPNSAVIDVHGVGYSLGVSMNTSASLPDIGEEVFLFVHHHITENSQALFGFLTAEERKVFRVLIAINKIGPKVAINVLSTLTVAQIAQAVEDQDVSLFKAVSGIGPKTASRLLLELKGKLDIAVTGRGAVSASSHEEPLKQAVEDEAYTALIALGYTEGQVKLALTKVAGEISDDAPVHEWITMALKVI